MGTRIVPRHICSLLAQSHNAIRFGGSLHKNNTSCLLLGLYHASVNWISIVLMQITPPPPKKKKILPYGIVQVVNKYIINECDHRIS